MLLRTALLGAALLGTPSSTSASVETPAQTTPSVLSVGDAAPVLAIGKWVKGEPVAAFQKGKTYIVEFWATWCGPCIVGMPHLSELQKKYADKGLTIIGVTREDPNNSLEQVETMVKAKGDVMSYTVAWDDAGKTNTAYMRAAQQQGIPCAFLVDGNGKIAYIGHPMSIDATLETVVAGKHDIAALAVASKKAKELESRGMKLQEELNRAANAKDWEAAIKSLDDMLAIDVEKFGGAAAAKYQILALEVGDMDRANKWAQDALDTTCKDSASALHSIAWAIVDPQSKVATPNPELATKLAVRAVEITKEKDGGILDTLARTWFVRGDLDKAVAFQRKAAALDPQLAGTLKEYEEALAKRG